MLRRAQTGSILVLTALLGFQSAGWLLVWRMAQSNAREQARIAIIHTDTPVQSLTIHAADLATRRMDKKEIRHEGRLYDIRSETSFGDSVTLTLYHDKHEESLLKTLGERLAAPVAGKPSGAPKMSWLAQLLGLIYLTPQAPHLPKAQENALEARAFPYLMPLRQAVPDLYALPPEAYPACS